MEYIVLYTVYSIQRTVYSVQCTVYSVQYTVYSVQFTVYYTERCSGLLSVTLSLFSGDNRDIHSKTRVRLEEGYTI